jgi:hypothetical protein
MSGLVIRLRIDHQDGDVFRVVHEDSGKVLATGSAKHWVDPKKFKPLPEQTSG